MKALWTGKQKKDGRLVRVVAPLSKECSLIEFTDRHTSVVLDSDIEWV